MFNRWLLLSSSVLIIVAFLAFEVNDSLGETEWDWVQILTQDTPSPRDNFAMAYDPVRKRVVIFGGLGTLDPHIRNNETWEYYDSNWHQIITPNSPAPLEQATMEYMPSMGGMILFGGANGSTPSTTFNDTWFYDGSDWTKLSPPQSPKARVGHGMAYDEQRDVLVMFGGQGFFSDFNDTWEFDGTTWVQIDPPVSPSSNNGPRRNHGMTYDKGRHKVVLFGGQDNITSFSETWEYDGTTWVQVTTPTVPLLKASANLAYFDSLNMVALFGARGDRDLWIYDGLDWTILPTDTTPLAEGALEFVYNSETDVIVAFGGRTPPLKIQL